MKLGMTVLAIAVVALAFFVIKSSDAGADDWQPYQGRQVSMCEPPVDPAPPSGDVVLPPAEQSTGIKMKVGKVPVAVGITLYGLQNVTASVLVNGTTASNIRSFDVKMRMQRQRLSDGAWRPYKMCWYNKPASIIIDGASIYYEDVTNWWLRSTKHRFRLVVETTMETDTGAFKKTKKKRIPSY